MKKDTTFGELIRAEAKKCYGDDFEFDKCTIEREIVGTDDKGEFLWDYVITFEIIHNECVDEQLS